MMDTVLVIRKKGKAIPEKFIQHLMDNQFHAGYGCAMYLPGNKMLFANGVPKPVDWATIEETQAGDALDLSAIYAFHKSDNNLGIEDIQPYILEGAGDEIKIVAFIDGACISSEQAQSAHEPVYHAAYDVLGQRVKLLMKMCGGNMQLFEEGFRDPFSYRDVMNSVLAGQRGAVVMLTNLGEGPMTFNSEENTDHADFDWGWISNAVGYGKTASGPKNDLGFSITKATTTKPAVDPKPAENKPVPVSPEKPPITVVPPKTATATFTGGTKTEIDARRGNLTPGPDGLIYPPLNVLGDRNASRNWYQKHCGNAAWKKMADSNGGKEKEKNWVFTGPGVPPKAIPDLAHLGNAVAAKDTTNHHIPAPEAKPAAVAATQVISSGEDKAKFHAAFMTRSVIKHALDPNAKEIPSMQQLQGMVGNFTTFCQEFGLTMDQVLRIPYVGGFDVLVREYPNASAKLLHDLRNQIDSYRADTVKFNEPAALGPNNITKLAAAGPAPAPAASSFMSGRKGGSMRG